MLLGQNGKLDSHGDGVADRIADGSDALDKVTEAIKECLSTGLNEVADILKTQIPVMEAKLKKIEDAEEQIATAFEDCMADSPSHREEKRVTPSSSSVYILLTFTQL